jgi:hypothetical protein
MKGKQQPVICNCESMKKPLCEKKLAGHLNRLPRAQRLRFSTRGQLLSIKLASNGCSLFRN